MDPATTAMLLAVNHQFYQTFAFQFSATRQRIQPGVQRLLPALLQANRILDLGCGNGELARRLLQQGFAGTYVGLDFSPGLLAAARQAVPPEAAVSFLPADLAQGGWEGDLPRESFDCVVAFAVLHHLPGQRLRQQVLCTARRLLAPQGRLMLSNWQFLNSPRLRQRILPWEAAGLRPDQVDEGDHLLDWRSGGHGLRYSHHFSLAELEQLAQACDFVISESFLSDGENCQTGLYQVWRAPA